MHDEHVQDNPEKRRPNLCLIDDDEIMLSLFSRIVERSGCQVELAQGPKAAISVLAAGTFDLVICDLRMPDMSDGEKLLGVIRKLYPQLPVFMMSCDITSTVHDRLMAAGASDCITKPLTVLNVVSLIQSLDAAHLHTTPKVA